MPAPLYVHLPSGGTLPALGPAPFIALVIADNVVMDDWRDDVCERLAGSGCRYLVAWGQDCVGWAHAMGKSAGENMIVTAAVEDEPLAEAMWFAVHETHHPAVTLEGLVIVHVTPRARRDEIHFQFHSAAMREKPGI
ncbi:MAG: hypothetical protein LCH56_09120 [Proteobacteria bacterium]|nr:hypothetical protein [Pseudomonadota bacterium]